MPDRHRTASVQTDPCIRYGCGAFDLVVYVDLPDRFCDESENHPIACGDFLVHLICRFVVLSWRVQYC
jgi:hypothetical protein